MTDKIQISETLLRQVLALLMVNRDDVARGESNWYMSTVYDAKVAALRAALIAAEAAPQPAQQPPNQSPSPEYDRGFSNGWDRGHAHGIGSEKP